MPQAASVILELENEIRILRRYLTTILDCADPTCSLCGACLHAAREAEPRIERPIPEIAEDDPVRTYKTPTPDLCDVARIA